MANNPHYRDLMRRARRDHLVNIRQVSGQIASLYEDAAKDLSAQAASMKKRTLSHRWATEYADALDKRARELRAGLYDVTYQGLKRSANLPIAADGDFWEAVGGQSFRDMFAVTPDDILTNLITGQIYQDNKGLSDRIWTASKTFEHDIDYMVNRGIAEHKSAYELAKDLEQYVKPKAKRDWDWGKVYPHLAGKQIDYNAQRLARTAINHSYFLANQKVCVQNPYVEVMHWELSDAHLFRQVIPFGPDECDDYAEHDEGFGMGNWKPEEIPLPHPQCLCVQYGVVPESLEAIGDEIGRWIAGESIPRLDRWNALYGVNYDRQNPSVWDLKNAADGGRMELTKAESAAVNAYISSESYVINDKLRRDIPLNEDETAIATGLDSALKKLPKYEGTVYRSMSSDMIQNLEKFWALHQVGNMVNYGAYTSTSLEVYDDTMDIQFVIQSKNGRDVTSYNPNEKEILFKRGSRFIITDIRNDIIFMEEV